MLNNPTIKTPKPNPRTNSVLQQTNDVNLTIDYNNFTMNILKNNIAKKNNKNNQDITKFNLLPTINNRYERT